ncbi:MAG: hypothetical protein HQK65_15220 [Desulfamplus sp.]|nr:hypothetical protein [Desulfamplus sp.]
MGTLYMLLFAICHVLSQNGKRCPEYQAQYPSWPAYKNSLKITCSPLFAYQTLGLTLQDG